MCIRDSFPRPVELRNLIVGDSDQLAIGAWELVCQAMVDHGAYKSVEFNDPRISRAISICGGWQNICERPVTWLQKDFERAFKLLARDVKPVKLLGIQDQENKQYRPVMIGPGHCSVKIEYKSEVAALLTPRKP